MVAAAILAGGKGRRLGGVDKPLLIVDGRRIIDRQLAILRPLFDAIVLVTADATRFSDLSGLADVGSDVDIVADRQGPGLGPLAGLDAALAWLPPRFDALVCVAGDMPFLAPPILIRLRDAPATGAVVPRHGRGPEPLCARYDRALDSLAASALSAGTRAMHDFLDLIPPHQLSFVDETELRRLDPELRTFANVNSPNDLTGR